MNVLTQAVDVLYTKNYTLYRAKGGGKIVTYPCASNQVIQGDPNNLWPGSGSGRGWWYDYGYNSYFAQR
jgi:hypothetical protein